MNAEKPAPDSPTANRPAMDRREFVRAALLVGAGAAASAGVALHARRADPPADPIGPDSIRDLKALPSLPASANEDPLVRMQRDLATAMEKPMEQRKWGMIIDQRKCVGCSACTIACVAENKLPPGVVYRPVVQEETGVFPNVKLRFTPRPCMQCDEPSCVPVCPVNATWKRPDGITTIDYDKCIGCRYCLTACPYGARTSDFGRDYTAGVAAGAPAGENRPLLAGARKIMPYEEAPSHEYGKNWDRAAHGSPSGNARKCTFCVHRLDQGQLPQCVTTCIGRATYFGDTNDPDSLITELLTKESTHTLLPHLGTKPTVHYIA
ncbi:MAG TPA: 4Fe-4S dicluster domain-containing protein [Opitutaceae bacterium]